MNNKYKIKFNYKINITLALVAVICIVGIICNSIFLSNAIKDEMPFTAYIVSMILLVLLLIFIPVFLFASYYNIQKEKFIICMCFYKKKIEYSDLLNIRHDKKTKQTIIYYYTYNKQGEQLVTMLYVNINEKYLDNFVNDLKDKNNMIIYDIFNKEENEQN